jgi:hypothetical protein
MDVNGRPLPLVLTPLALLVILLAGPIDARAQLSDTAGLLAVSVGWGTNDAQRPDPFDYTIDRAVYAVGGAAFVSRRVALGAEWVRLGAVTAPYRSVNNTSAEVQQEHAVFGSVRARAASRERIAVDVTGAAGVLMQSRELSSRSRLVETRSVTARSPAFAARVELPVALARHAAIAPAAAVYFLRRAEATEALALSRTEPSIRMTFGVTAQVIW